MSGSALNHSSQPLAVLAITITLIACITLFAGYVAYPIYLLQLNVASVDEFLVLNLLDNKTQINAVPFGQILAIGLIALPKLIGIYAFAKALTLFRHYRNGVPFSLKTTQRVGSIGWNLILVALAEMLGKPLAILLLTNFNYTGGTYGGNFHIGWGLPLGVTLAILLMLMSRILTDAVLITEENKKMV